MRRGIRFAVAALILHAALPSQAAPDDPVRPEVRADIGRLMEITGARAMGEQMGQLVANQVIDAMKQARPEFPEEAVAIVKEVVADELKDDALWDRLVPIYAEYFSHEEIKQLIAFYETPLGKKTIALMPQLLADSVRAGQEWALASQANLEKRLRERLDAAGFGE